MYSHSKSVLVAIAGLCAVSAQAQVSLEIFGSGFGATDVSADGSVIVGNSINDSLYQQAHLDRGPGLAGNLPAVAPGRGSARSFVRLIVGAVR